MLDRWLCCENPPSRAAEQSSAPGMGEMDLQGMQQDVEGLLKSLATPSV